MVAGRCPMSHRTAHSATARRHRSPAPTPAKSRTATTPVSHTFPRYLVTCCRLRHHWMIPNRLLGQSDVLFLEMHIYIHTPMSDLRRRRSRYPAEIGIHRSCGELHLRIVPDRPRSRVHISRIHLQTKVFGQLSGNCQLVSAGFIRHRGFSRKYAISEFFQIQD